MPHDRSLGYFHAWSGYASSALVMDPISSSPADAKIKKVDTFMGPANPGDMSGLC
jgi:hypothetical protein